MKLKNRALKTISMFALSLILLMGAVLPMSAAGSSPDEYMASYTVKSGDTLSSIAAKYGVTVASIVKENDISASATLFPGQSLNIPGATSVHEDSTTSFGSSSTITAQFKEADLVGVLETILAHTGYTMIFKGTSSPVTINLPGVSPLTAIDYVLRMVEMTYIKHDNIIYVGNAATLNASFADKQALTKFTVKYISVDTLMSHLSTLGVAPTLVKMENDNRDFWLTGTPMELAKVKQVINTLDVKKNVTTGSGAISSSLTAIELKHIAASEFSSLLQTLGLHAGITMSAHPMTLYVYVSGDALNDIMKIKKLVDFEDVNAVEPPTGSGDEGGTADKEEDKGNTGNTDTDKDTGADKDNGKEDGTTSDVVISDGETSLVKLTLQYINKDAAKNILSTFGYKVEVLGLDLYEKVIWLRGATDEVNEAIEQIKEHDISGNNTEKVSFTYDLQNIVASELQNKISNMDVEGVEFYFGSYPELTKSIIVYCPANQVESVKNVIATLDSNLGKMYYPISTITSNDELQALATKEALVVKFLNNPGITVDSFILSEDLDPTEGVKYILYVCESPENIDLISNMWSTIG
ncbi:MAG: LysM peptidoglycan-binding domain-containing protein [Ruminococcaceae bacterium]|nr:LysM peptidoglycan-binding domain-containing protein [Oscillospiraceae bacterium]